MIGQTMLDIQDLNRCVSKLPKDIVELMTTNGNLYIAGGFVRACVVGETINDIDFFGASEALLEQHAITIANGRAVRYKKSKNAFTVICHPRAPVQFIKRWLYDDPAALINDFDFTIAQAAIWFNLNTESWHSVCSQRFYPDLAAKRLWYTYPQRDEDGGGSILRAFKFVKKGYHIAPEAIGGVVARMVTHMAIDPSKTIQELGEKWVGTAMGQMMREVDPLRIVDGVELNFSENQVEEDVIPF